jgi:integrase
VEALRARQRAARRSKVQPSQECRKKGRPRRQPGERYRTTSYSHAIRQARLRAGVAVWHPHQLRHSHATEVRKRFGLEAAQVALGHAQANVTEVYAERDLNLAVRVAAELG